MAGPSTTDQESNPAAEYSPVTQQIPPVERHPRTQLSFPGKIYPQRERRGSRLLWTDLTFCFDSVYVSCLRGEEMWYSVAGFYIFVVSSDVASLYKHPLLCIMSQNIVRLS